MLNKKLSLVLITLLAASCSSNATKSSTQVETPKVEATKVEVKETEKMAKETEEMTVWFDTDKYDLTEAALKTLDKNVLPEIKEAGDVKVTIAGHCDERGSVKYNKKLGKNRAEAVKSYLSKNGVKASKIKTITYGKSKPVDSGHDESAWEKNRRAVTIIIEKK